MKFGTKMPTSGRAFISVRDSDKAGIVEVARQLADVGLELVATRGTAQLLMREGLRCDTINKVREGSPHCVELIDAQVKQKGFIIKGAYSTIKAIKKI